MNLETFVAAADQPSGPPIVGFGTDFCNVLPPKPSYG